MSINGRPENFRTKVGVHQEGSALNHHLLSVKIGLITKHFGFFKKA